MTCLACACSNIFSLAQNGSESMLPVFGWSLVLIALLVGGFFGIARLRQWLKSDDADASPGPGGGFTLSDLRQLHKQGKMTDAEFERLKGMILGNAKAMTARMPDPLARDTRDGGDNGPPRPRNSIDS
jgi:hypothetical protein